MKAHFQVEFIENEQVVETAACDNLLLDAGVSAIINSGNGLFAFPGIGVGSSDYPPKVTQPGLLLPLDSSEQNKTKISVCSVDDLSPFVNFGISAFFDDAEANGIWSEITFNGWNRALLSAPGKLLDGDHRYMVTSFNDFGESVANTPKLVNVSSPAMASQLKAKKGLTSLPHKIELDGKTVQDDVVEMHFMTLSWAVNVSGCFRKVYSKRPSRTEKNWAITFYLKRDNKYYYNWLGQEYLMEPQPVGGIQGNTTLLLSDGDSVEWIAEIEVGPWPGPSGATFIDGNGNSYSEENFWENVYHGGPVAIGSFTSIFKSYYKIVSQNHGLLTGTAIRPELGPTVGLNLDHVPSEENRTAYDVIGDPNNTDPYYYDVDRDDYQPFTTFWGWDNKLFNLNGTVKAPNRLPFSGEVFDCPYFRIRMWEGLGVPYIDDISEFTITTAGKTGGVYIEWKHVNQIGPSGWPTGYRLYKMKSDNSGYGLLEQIPAVFEQRPGEPGITGHGVTHFWDNGDIVPGAAPQFTFAGPELPNHQDISVEAKAGLIPKTYVKTDKMQARVNVQVYFYDLNTSQSTKIVMEPESQTIRAGEFAALTAFPANDYGDQVPGEIDWSTQTSGVIMPSPDTFSANFTHIEVGEFVVETQSGPLTNSSTVEVVPSDVALIQFDDLIIEGDSSALLEYSWNANKTELTVTYPVTEALDGTKFRVTMDAYDEYTNEIGDFLKNWEMDGVSQRLLDVETNTYGFLGDVDNTVFTLKPDGGLILKEPGTVIMEVREIIDNQPAPYSKTLQITFEWR